MREGLAFVASDARAVIVLGVVTVLSVAGFNFHVIVPLLASDTLHLGPEAFGFLAAAFGAGALAGALAAAALGPGEPAARSSAGTAGFGADDAGARARLEASGYAPCCCSPSASPSRC